MTSLTVQFLKLKLVNVWSPETIGGPNRANSPSELAQVKEWPDDVVCRRALATLKVYGVQTRWLPLITSQWPGGKA